MGVTFSEGMQRGVGPEWEDERSNVNPTAGFILLTVGGSTLIFLALAWLFEVLLGIGWPLILVSLFFAVTLIQSPPSDLTASAPASRKFPFLFAAWAGRGLLIFGLFGASSMTFNGDSISWGNAVFSALLVMPLLWLPLHQLRQYGLLSFLGVLPSLSLLGAAVVTLSQAGLILLAWGFWVADTVSLSIKLSATIVALGWLMGGNVVLSALTPQSFLGDESA